MKIYHSKDALQLSANSGGAWFFFIILYLVIDYGRPQDLFPFLNFIRPGMLVTLVLIMFLIHHIHTGVFQGNNKQITMMWLFIALLTAFIPYAVHTHRAYTTTRNMISLMPFILSTVICIKSVSRLKKMLLIYVCLMIYIAAFALLHHGIGSGNYFQDENDVALFINMWIPFCYFLFLSEKKATKVFHGIGLAIGVAAVVASDSRGGFVGLVTVFFVIWLFSPKKIFSLGIVALVWTLVFLFAGDEYRATIATIAKTEDGTSLERIQSWKAGWNMFLQNPLGVGGNNFGVRFPEYQPAEMPRNMWGREAHSLWFTLLSELGVFGVLIYFKLLYCNVRDSFLIKAISDAHMDENSHYFSSVSRAFIASLAGFFSSGSFISVLYYPHYWYLTALVVATKMVAEGRRHS